MGSLLKNIPNVDNKSGWPWTEETSPEIYNSQQFWPKISIVTPSFNQGKYIEETIRSILLQNYPNLEFIVIDGGSTDSTIDILKKYNNWITYWISEPDTGQSDAINKGINQCSGQYFNWINSDDFLNINALFHCFTNLKDEINIVGGFLNVFLDGENYKMVNNYRIKCSPSDIEDTIVFHEMCQPATFFKLDVIRKLGNTDPQLHYIMDLYLWCKYLIIYGTENVKLIDEVVAHFRQHQDSKTVSNAEKFISEEKEMYKFFASLYTNNHYFLNLINPIDHKKLSFTNLEKHSFINSEKFLKLIAKKFILGKAVGFYDVKNYNELRPAILSYFRSGYPELSIQSLKLFIASYLPSFLTNLFRKP